MFGLFKKKKSAKDAKFEVDLVQFAADFSDVMRAIDPQGADEIFTRSFNNYYARDAGEIEYIASDFYFDALTGALFELTDNALIAPQSSLGMFSMVDSFLRGNPRYQTRMVLGLMDTWQRKLIELGAIKT